MQTGLTYSVWTKRVESSGVGLRDEPNQRVNSLAGALYSQVARSRTWTGQIDGQEKRIIGQALRFVVGELP